MTINLKKSSLQRIFEFGLKHGRKQGCRAMKGTGCAMRGENGTKCIVGAMIDDVLAERCDRGVVVSGPQITEAEWFALIGKNEKKYTLLRAMQNAHDDTGDDFTETFEASMQRVAETFGLHYAEPGVTLRT